MIVGDALSDIGGILSDILGSTVTVGVVGGFPTLLVTLTCALVSLDVVTMTSPTISMSVSDDSPDFSSISLTCLSVTLNLLTALFLRTVL